MLRLCSMLLVFVVCVFPLKAGAQPLVLSSTLTAASVAPDLTFFEDPTRQLSLIQVIALDHAADFQPNTRGKVLNFGRTRSAWWVHFTVINPLGTEWYLLLDSLLGDEFALYIFPEGNNNTSISTANYATRIDSFQRRLWKLHLPQGETFHIYLRATNGNAILRLPIEFLSDDVLLERSNRTSLVLGGLYVSLLLLATYQILMFVSLHESSYLFLSVHILAMAAMVHRTNPIFNSLGFLSETAAYFYTAPLLVAIATYLLFTRQVFDLPRDYPQLSQLYLSVARFCLMAIAVVGLIPGGTFIPSLLALVFYVLEIPTSAYLAYCGNRIALYFGILHLVALVVQVWTGWLVVVAEEKWSPAFDLFLGVVSLLLIFPVSWLQSLRINTIREQARRANAEHKAKDAFLAVMSHELRTPLHAIVGLTGLLKWGVSREKHANYLERLYTAAQHQLHLIGNILDMAKVETQTLQLEEKPFQLNMAVGAVLGVMRQSAEQKGLELVLRWQGENNAISILGDRLRLTQVLMNLLGNAVKYTHYGAVTLTVTPQYGADGRYAIRFEVADTGIGIPPERLVSLFEPFVQMAGQTGLQQGGVGLGLAISKRLVTAMGGELVAHSTYGEGSLFAFLLHFKAVETRVEREEDAITHLILSAGLRVLLVDDSEINRFVGAEMLKNLGVEYVTLAPDGEAAILQLQQQDFDMVLLDINMPGVDGFGVTRWLRRYGRNSQIPVIALTADVLPAIAQRGKEVGINALLTKPFEYADLFKVMQQVLHPMLPIVLDTAAETAPEMPL